MGLLGRLLGKDKSQPYVDAGTAPVFKFCHLMNAIKKVTCRLGHLAIILAMSSQLGIIAQPTNPPPLSGPANTIAAQKIDATTADLSKGHTTVPQFLEQFVFTILGGLIAGLIGIWTANVNRKRSAKNAFRVLISRTFGTADYSYPEELSKWYRSTKEEIHIAVLELLPLLSRKKAARLNKVWYDYSHIELNDFTLTNEDDFHSKLTSKLKPSEIILSFKARFLKAAN